MLFLYAHTMRIATLFLAAFPLLTLASAQKISLKVNLGGGPVGDFLGEEQVIDMTGFSKNVAHEPIQNTDQPEVFQAQRFARSSDMTFRIPVPDGIYSVTLLFAETFRPACVPGARVFDISLGTPVSGVTKIIDKFDVFGTAGCAAAHGKRFDGVPSKEGIVVHLSQVAQHPSLAGFVVEGFPQPKGNGQEYKAIARAELNPMAGGVSMIGSDAQPDTAQAAPLSTDSLQSNDMQSIGAPPMGGKAASMDAPTPGADYQTGPGPMTGATMNAPPPTMNRGYQTGMTGAGQQPMDVGQMPMGGVQSAYRGRRRLLSMGDSEEELVAEYHDIPLPNLKDRSSRVYSRGLKGIHVKADKMDVGSDPDIALQN